MIKIFTDTSANLPQRLIEKYSLKVVPFTFTINKSSAVNTPSSEEEYKEFYNAMRNGDEVSTSMINTKTFETFFDEELKCGNDIIYIGMSSGISGSAGAALLAAKEMREKYPERKIYIVDTLAASLGEGLLVIKAAKAAEDKSECEKIVEEVENLKHKMCQYFTVDDLKYLRKGGRISKAAAVIGNIMNIKPILTGDSFGKIVLCARARGQKRALAELAQKYEELCIDKKSEIGIAHADNPKAAEELYKLLKNKGLEGECLNVYYEAVTGSHVGPGTVALFFLGKHK